MTDDPVIVCANPSCPQGGFCNGACFREWAAKPELADDVMLVRVWLTHFLGHDATDFELEKYILGNEEERAEMVNRKDSHG